MSEKIRNLPPTESSEFSWFGLLNALGPLLALGGVLLLFWLLDPKILSSGNIEEISRQTVIVASAAVGMTLIIISGGIDLSVGSMMAFVSVVAATMMRDYGWSPAAAALVGLTAGTACGLANGTIITSLRMMPFIVTLGMMSVLRGSALGLAEQAPVNLTGTWLSELMYVGGKDVQWSDPIRWGILWPGRVLMILTIAVAAGAMLWRALRGKGSYASIIRLGLALLLGAAGGYAIYAAWYWAPGIWLTAMFALAVSLMLRYTRLGRHIVAIGSNEQTARLCGVAVRKVKIFVYAMGGLAAALGGLMLTAKQDQGDPTGQIGAELDVIAAVVIGGGSLSGGVGSIWGSIIGAFIMQTIRYGCTMVGLEAWITQIVTGGIIIAAVALDRLRHRRSA